MVRKSEPTDPKRKKVSRRGFLKTAGAAAGFVALAGLYERPLGGLLESVVRPAYASVQVAQTPLPGRNIPKYVDALPHFAGLRATGTSITVGMEEFQQMVLPGSMYAGLAAPFNAGTYVWGYKVGSSPRLYPGFTVEAQRGTPTTVTYENNLPNPPVLQQYITVDRTLHWADPLNQGMQMTPYAGPPPVVTHLHGGEVPSDFDGGPDEWFTPNGIKGPGYRTKTLTAPNAAVYEYPNEQEATTLWFHDHCLGATRLNVYCGLAAFYFLRDSRDTGLSNNPIGLPAGDYEIEIAIQDRQFDTNGQWLFPDGFPAGLNGPPPNPTVHPFWNPEFFGDAIVINGKTWPYLEVEPRRYRFRFLDGSNARFYSMRLMNMVTGLPGPAIWQIGTDGGLLDAPVKVSFPKELFLAPGERADVIIDFAGFAGQTLTLRNSAKAPYPGGVPPDPNTTGQIMQFRVVKPLIGTDTSYNPAAPATALRSPLISRLVNPVTGTLAPGITPSTIRQLTLNEVLGPGGPLEVLVNNTKWVGKDPQGNVLKLADSAAPQLYVADGHGNYLSELPANGSIEQWEIINLTADAHPIHLHLVQVQLLNRQRFQTSKYMKAYAALFPGGGIDPATGLSYPPGVYMPAYGPPKPYNQYPLPGAIPPIIGGNPDVTPFLQGSPTPPDPNEAGWKDTVKMFPGEVTRIVVRFTKQDDNPYGFDATGTTPVAYNKDGVLAGGPGYVWHCHIVDHEDNEMMRPYHPV